MHAHHHRRHAVVARIAALESSRKRDTGDLLQQDGAAILPGHRDAGQILSAIAAPQVADQVLAAVQVDEAAASIAGVALDRLLDLGERDAELRHACGVGGDAQRAHLAADRDDLRDPGNGQQAWTQHEIGIFTRLHRSCYRRLAIPRHQWQSHQHDLAHDGRDRSHHGRDVARHLRTHDGQALGHQLAVTVDVGAPVEFSVDKGQAHARCAAHTRHPGHTVECGLKRKGH